MTTKALRLPPVINRKGLSRSTIYQFMRDGEFPASLKLGHRAVGWFEQDITAWLERRKTNAAAPSKKGGL